MILRSIAMLICTIAAILLIHLAYLWSTVGYGLNPLVALPSAAFIYFTPLIVLLNEHRDL